MSTAAFTPQDLRQIILRWERLRIVYNLVLLGPGIIAAVAAHHVRNLATPDVVWACLLFGAAANLCFILGPYTEVCSSTLSLRLGRWRYALFAIGLAGSLLLIGCMILRIL